MLHLTPRRAAAVLGTSLVLSVLATVPSPAVEGFTFTRIAGDDRYETAAAAALEAFATAEAAVIARGDDFPDALAGTYLSGALGAPILLTETNALPEVTASALDSLGVTTVYLLGGSAAISDAVEAEVAGEGETARTVERVAGANRYGTAADIATGQDAASIGEVGGERAAFLASGTSFADALAAGPLAHAQRLPIILTPAGSLAPEARTAIEDLGIEHLVVVGGTAAVSDAVVTAATAGGASSERVAGDDRYETATEIADFALDEFSETDETTVDLATGEKFADALAAGPSAGEANRPLVLTRTATLSAPTATWLTAHAGTLEEGRVFGGTAAVAQSVVDAAEAAASGDSSGAGPGQLTAIDKAANSYRFVPDGADEGETITYADRDTFVVNGAPATIGGFEAAATPGDRVTYTPAAGTTAARHDLTDVAATSINEGTVGNVDAENDQLDIINAVNGDAVRSNLTYTSVLFTVNGATATLATFEGAVNEGDTLEITGTGAQTTYALTDTDVVGTANTIAADPNPLLPSTSFKIDALGDDPASDADDTYVADGDDEFTVDGQDAEYDAFAADLTAGDAVTHSRTAGVETYELINRSPSTIEGDAVDDLDPTSGPLPTQTGGGSFTVVTEDGPEDVSYDAGGTYVVDGSLSSESEFEAAYTAGDEVSFRAADAPSGTTQRLELTNKTLQGQVDPESVNTADDAGLPGTAPAPNSYGVLGRDGETVVRQVEYTGEPESSNTYFVNGAAVTLERFEQELDAIAAGTRSGSAQVATTGTGDSAVTQHRLTTTGAPITATTTTTAA